jgi:hypothetical protein
LDAKEGVEEKLLGTIFILVVGNHSYNEFFIPKIYHSRRIKFNPLKNFKIQKKRRKKEFPFYFDEFLVFLSLRGNAGRHILLDPNKGFRTTTREGIEQRCHLGKDR